MLKKRLIPKLQLKKQILGGSSHMVLVTTIQFGKVIDIGDPISQAKIFQAQAADELIFLDIDPYSHNQRDFVDIIRHASEEIFMPLTVGGGIRSIEDIRLFLQNGADKVSINTAAVETPNFVSKSSSYFGSQCIVVNIDFKLKQNKAIVVTDCGNTETELDVVSWAKTCEELGAGEILLTSIDRDGTGKGLATDVAKLVSNVINIPVILSGGCGLTQHFIDGFQDAQVDAISAGTYFCFKDENPMQTRSQLNNAGIPIRIHT
ncbi:MAG: imidazole glycerol phosphate synthase subunit HisF [Candidatus Margulisbacteria bacterium]|nr:imidazole glycerol phosphate synthase subunit HisF [Candidatus Margulisiibacteriota bacterium]